MFQNYEHSHWCLKEKLEIKPILSLSELIITNCSHSSEFTAMKSTNLLHFYRQLLTPTCLRQTRWDWICKTQWIELTHNEWEKYTSCVNFHVRVWVYVLQSTTYVCNYKIFCSYIWTYRAVQSFLENRL